MKRQYHVGLDTNNVSAAVDVGTRGIAYTALYQVRSGGQSIKVAESGGDGSGDINQIPLGQATALAKSYIVTRTIIDLSQLNLTDKQRETEVKNLSILYYFDGGFSGSQKYNFDTDDITVTPDNMRVVVTKAIEMV